MSRVRQDLVKRIRNWMHFQYVQRLQDREVCHPIADVPRSDGTHAPRISAGVDILRHSCLCPVHQLLRSTISEKQRIRRIVARWSLNAPVVGTETGVEVRGGHGASSQPPILLPFYARQSLLRWLLAKIRSNDNGFATKRDETRMELGALGKAVRRVEGGGGSVCKCVRACVRLHQSQEILDSLPTAMRQVHAMNDTT